MTRSSWNTTALDDEHWRSLVADTANDNSLALDFSMNIHPFFEPVPSGGVPASLEERRSKICARCHSLLEADFPAPTQASETTPLDQPGWDHSGKEPIGSDLSSFVTQLERE